MSIDGNSFSHILLTPSISIINPFTSTNKINHENQSILEQRHSSTYLNDPNYKQIKCNVIVYFAYTDIGREIEVDVKLLKDNQLLLNDLMDNIKIKSPISLSEYGISYYDIDKKTYINCGKYPLKSKVMIKCDKKENEDSCSVNLKIRQIIPMGNALRMEFCDEEVENNEEIIAGHSVDKKSKRAKERKIGYIVKKVYMWRKMYNGFTDDNGANIKLTLEEAADKIGISKKSLDDYLIQLRMGKNHGFDFNEHKNDKVGVLRAFVKKKKNEVK